LAKQWIYSIKATAVPFIGCQWAAKRTFVHFGFEDPRALDWVRQAIADKVEAEIDLPGLVLVPLKTVTRWQPRLNWSKGWVTEAALARCLAILDALPEGTRALVTAHHPLREVGTKGTALTRHGQRALAELAKRPVLAVLSASDLIMLEQTLMQCPYCAETITTEVDGCDCQGYIEDCPICCRLIAFTVERDGRGELVRRHARREDD
jgi:hypothetical protein